MSEDVASNELRVREGVELRLKMLGIPVAPENMFLLLKNLEFELNNVLVLSSREQGDLKAVQKLLANVMIEFYSAKGPRVAVEGEVGDHDCQAPSQAHTVWYRHEEPGDYATAPRVASAKTHAEAMQIVYNWVQNPTPRLRWVKVFHKDNANAVCWEWENPNDN